MNILITSAGRRVSLVKFFQSELRAIYADSKVFTADVKPELSAACAVSDKYFKVPPFKTKEYIGAIEEICLSNDIKMVVPTHDSELLVFAENKKAFLDKGILLLVSESSFVEKCRDKRVIHEFFKSKGISIAHEYDKNNYELPIFIKPIDGSRSEGTRLIKRRIEIKKEYLEDDRLMFLEYLDHDKYDEYTCDLYYDKTSQLKCVVPRKRIEVRDGEVNKGVTIRNEIIPFIKQNLSSIPGAIGCLTSQFFMHHESGRIVGIEINPRFGGGFPLTYLSGANYVKWLLEEYFLQQEIEDQFDVWEEDLLMLRYDDEVIVNGFKSN